LAWPRLIAVRRIVGIAACAYALAHFTGFIVAKSFDLQRVVSEIVLRINYAVGAVGLILLSLLAATSTDAVVKRIGGKRWQLLHRAAYLAAAVALTIIFSRSRPISPGRCWWLAWRDGCCSIGLSCGQGEARSPVERRRFSRSRWRRRAPQPFRKASISPTNSARRSIAFSSCSLISSLPVRDRRRGFLLRALSSFSSRHCAVGLPNGHSKKINLGGVVRWSDIGSAPRAKPAISEQTGR
jgi:Ferric reductase like transmembrane component